MPVTRPTQRFAAAPARALLLLLTALLVMACGPGHASADNDRQRTRTVSAVQVDAPADIPQAESAPDGKDHCGGKQVPATQPAVHDNGHRDQDTAHDVRASSKTVTLQRPAGRPHPGGPAPPAPDLAQLSVLRI
ncbi:hypothetical protein [Streptomyces meridianus]|uniref:Secreted protein n=1 Tax=Streptomyces meridianus TaxID=2938945 RepID=A0ABT0X7C1_9ACTN|nr:hypothetical protein [Streptomyces meridianus]MCM2578428.1 hypothetical protein [Streptomyces meridianus]